MLKLLLKLLALPLVAVLTVIRWAWIFLASFSAVIIQLVAGLVFLITIAAYFIGAASGGDALKMLAVSFAMFLIPHIAELIAVTITAADYRLRDFIRS